MADSRGTANVGVLLSLFSSASETPLQRKLGIVVAGGAVSALILAVARHGLLSPKCLEEVPGTMRALHLLTPDKDLEKVSLEVRKVPTPVPKAGQVLVRMAAAPVNATDAGEWRHKNKQTGPQQLGIEGSGTVVACGGGSLVGRCLLGKKVGVIGARTYGEYAVTSAIGGALPLPASLPMEDACAFFINPFTVIGILDTARSLGAKAFINTAAASQQGLMLARYSALNGITLVSLVRGPHQVHRLQQAGSAYVIDTSKHSWTEELAGVVRSERIRLAFDCLSGKMTGILVGILPPNSIVYVYGGLADDPAGEIRPADLIYKRKRVEGWLLTAWLWDQGILRGLWRLYTTYREVSQLLATTFSTTFRDVPMEAALDAYRRPEWRKGATLRILLS
mmetsp:Transcript_32082/g.75294  ORF Transcript_32082/g.75294 Transcript_32082/m.75294 type:complete len:393 (-) Transcript_32082:15-1193(-)